MWTSPKKLIPMQKEIETYSKGWGEGNHTLEELTEIIRSEGYRPDSMIETIEVDGILFIVEGHHRNFASANLGKTLVPYTVLAKDDESIPGSKTTARRYSSFLNKGILFGHEGFFDEKDENGKVTKMFSYKDIYPEIYQKTNEDDMERY